MNGLVLGITVDGKPTAPTPWRPAKRLRLFVQSDSAPGDRDRRFGYVLQRGAEPKADSLEYPGPVLVLTRGEPTTIEVINRSGEATAVHWHGIELESYYDGVAGWSGTPGRTAPAIGPGQRFEVRITPKRAGTFMYHTHMDELRQQYGGLVGALVVLEPGERWDPARDSALLAWRPIAKDGFTLPPGQAAVRPSVVNLPSGETADFEVTPDRPGEVVMEVWSGPARTPTLHGRLPFRVSPAAGDSGSAKSSGARARPRR